MAADPVAPGAGAAEQIQDYSLSRQQLEDMYYYMLLARRLDERMLALNRQGRAAARAGF